MGIWNDARRAMSAPQAPQPGSGMGNIPFAPGVMSGEYGVTPQARSMYDSMAQASSQFNQPMAQTPQSSGQGQAPQASMGQSQQPPPSQQTWTPQVQMQVLQYLMSLTQGQQQGRGQGWRMSTTGGFNQGNPYRQG